jgi:carboxyl-terminal processing protease
MHHLRKAGLAAALGITFVMGGFILPDRTVQSGPNLFRDVLTLVSTRYIDTLDIAEVYERAAEGLVHRLGDPYAELYSPDDLEEFTMTYEGHYAGVGMLIESQEGVPVVRRVFPNTPAERNGVRAGDRLVSIDKAAVEGWPLERVANALKGAPGSIVEVEFRRYGVPRPLAASIIRAVVRIPAVPYATVVDGDVGYIPVLQFNETAAEEVASALGDLIQRGARGVVLDLRGNGGGMVEQAVEIAGFFLPAGADVARQWERGSDDSYYRNTSAALVPDMPMVVLVDDASASASEIVAGALQDHDRAVVLGTTSFGKGLVQTAYRVDGGYILKMTTGKWYTPSGRSIHRERTLVNGRLMEVDDSVHFGTTLEQRPTYRSVGGRLVYGGGGIMPDLEVRSDTLSGAEQRLVAALLPRSPEFSVVVFEYATELKETVDREFTVTPEWRDEVYRRLVDRDVELERSVYDGGASYIDRVLTDQVGRLAFGDAYVLVREVGTDAALLRAIDVLKQGGSEQRGLFGYVDSVKAGHGSE